MTSAPPLPPPLPPAVAARAVSETARAAAAAWAQPMDPAQSSRALSQLFSVLRDLGIAARGLARYQTADLSPPGFQRLIETSAQLLLDTDLSLRGVLAAEGLGPVPVPDEPGMMLCRAARSAITAWRQPAGTSAERDATVAQLITAVEFLAAATQSLMADAPRGRLIGLRAVACTLTEVTKCLSEAIQPAQRTGEQK